MATSDERRREVAENLREIDEAWPTLVDDLEEDPLRFGALAMAGILACVDDRAVFRRLADLIDPTCKLRFDSVHQDFVCTHCGAWFDGFQTYDGHGKWNDMRYCPKCGARVVSGDE